MARANILPVSVAHVLQEVFLPSPSGRSLIVLAQNPGIRMFPALLPRDRGVFGFGFVFPVLSGNNASVLQVITLTAPPQSLGLLRERPKWKSWVLCFPTVVADSLLYACPTEGDFCSLFPCFQYFLWVQIEGLSKKKKGGEVLQVCVDSLCYHDSLC